MHSRWSFGGQSCCIFSSFSKVSIYLRWPSPHREAKVKALSRGFFHPQVMSNSKTKVLYMYVFHKAILDIWNVENVPAVEYEWESLNGLKWQGLRGAWRPTSYIATFTIGARSTITSWVNLNLTTNWFRSDQMGLMEIIISGAYKRGAYKRGACRDCNIVIIGAKDTGDCNEWKCLESVVDGLLLDFFWTFKNPI